MGDACHGVCDFSVVPIRIQPAQSLHCGILFCCVFVCEPGGLANHCRSEEEGKLPHLRMLGPGAIHMEGRMPVILFKTYVQQLAVIQRMVPQGRRRGLELATQRRSSCTCTFYRICVFFATPRELVESLNVSNNGNKARTVLLHSFRITNGLYSWPIF
jgi:hypothetical protein